MMAHNPFNVMQVYCQQGEKKFMKQKKIAFQWCYLIENSENQYFICIFYYLLHLIYIYAYKVDQFEFVRKTTPRRRRQIASLPRSLFTQTRGRKSREGRERAKIKAGRALPPPPPQGGQYKIYSLLFNRGARPDYSISLIYTKIKTQFKLFNNPRTGAHPPTSDDKIQKCNFLFYFRRVFWRRPRY